MLLSALLEQLHEFAPQCPQGACDGREFHSWQPLAEGARYSDTVLYVGALSQFRALSAVEPIPSSATFLCVCDTARAAADEPEENVVLVPAPAAPAGVVRRVAEIFSEEARIQAGMQSLVLALNANRGLQYLVDEAANILGNPLIIIDLSYKILAVCKVPFRGRPDIEEQKRLGYMLPENVDDLHADGIYRRLRETRYPYYTKQGGRREAWVNTLVFMHGMEVAEIGVMEQDHPVTEEGIRLVHFFSELVSLELQKDDFYKLNRGFRHSFFLSELLDGHVVDQQVVDLRLRHLSWKPSAHMYVMVLMSSDAQIFAEKANIIAQYVRDLFPEGRWAMYERSIVFLLNMPDDSTAFMDEEGVLSEYLRTNALSAALSAQFSNLLSVRKCYRQAHKAIEIGRRLDADRTIYYYPEYLCQHIGTILEEDHDLTDFIHPALLEIVRYDEAHKTNLLETLEQHLLHSDNPTLVAANLFIHRNTLFYRIAKIKDMFHLDLSDGNERMELLMSMKFLRLLQ